MTETKNFYQQFGFHPETIGLRHRHFNIIVEPDEMDQQGGAQAGDICVRARDGAANPMDFEAVRKPNFINTLEDDFDPTYRYYWFRPLSEPMTETKDDVAGLEAALACAKQQCETAVYNIKQREHDETVVRSFQSIADFCAREALSRQEGGR